MGRRALTEEEKAERRRAKYVREQADKIQAQKAQKPVDKIDISIEWKKGTYGWCPRATARVYFADGSFEFREGYRAGGYGYDKESTVVAEIFNDFLAYKIHDTSCWVTEGVRLYQDGEDNRRPYGMYHKVDAEGVEYAHYAGGIGMSCYFDIAKFIGGHLEKTGSGKAFDCYRYTDLTNKQSQS